MDIYRQTSACLDYRKYFRSWVLDATYQDESSHYQPCYPHEGGTDNSLGHMTLTTYDMRAGIAVDSNTETTSIDEMRFVKEVWRAWWWTSQKKRFMSSLTVLLLKRDIGSA